MTFKIAIIDDDPLVREKLFNHFSISKKIDCVLAVESIEKFLKYYRSYMQLDLILIDAILDRQSSIYHIPKLQNQVPSADIIIFTSINDSNTIFQAFTYGASGYLLKDISVKQLESRIIAYIKGDEPMISSSVARKIIHYFQPQTSFPEKVNQLLAPKESLVMEMLRDGFSYDQISERLGLSINGTRYYVKSIYKKMQVNSRGELIRKTR